VSSRQCDSILSHCRFSSWGVSSDHDTVALLESVDCALLEIIQFKIEFDGGVWDQLSKLCDVNRIFNNPLFIFCKLLQLLLRCGLTISLLCHDSQVESWGFSLHRVVDDFSVYCILEGRTLTHNFIYLIRQRLRLNSRIQIIWFRLLSLQLLIAISIFNRFDDLRVVFLLNLLKLRLVVPNTLLLHHRLFEVS
jgi:hypothetical protein